MTVTTENAITTQVGNGVAVDFTFDFQTLDEAHINAYEDDVLDAGVTVVLNADQSTSPGGTVTFPVAPANLSIVAIVRNMDYQQNTDYTVGGPFQSEAHETALDKNTMQVQQLKKEVSGAIKIPVSEDPATYPMELPAAGSRANLYLAFDANGNMSLTASGSADPNAMQRPAVGPEDNIVLFSSLKDGKNSGIAISSVVLLALAQTLTNKTLTSPKINEILDTNNNEVVDFPTIASAVNFFRFLASATGNTLQVQAQGDDTNVNIALVPKGNGAFLIDTIQALTTDGDLILLGNGSGRVIVPHRGALVYGSTQSIPNGSVPTTVNWPSESYDTDSIHSTVTNTGRLTVPSGVVKVRLSAGITLTSGATSVIVRIDKNVSSAYPGVPNPINDGGAVVSTPVLNVTGGDFFQCVVRQSGAAAENVDVNSWFAMEIIE